MSSVSDLFILFYFLNFFFYCSLSLVFEKLPLHNSSQRSDQCHHHIFSIINANKVEFWDAAIPVAITTAIEPVLGIISVSIPTLAPLLPWKPRERLNSTSDGRSEQPSSKKSYRMGRMTKKSSRWPEHQSQEVVGPSPTDTSIERAIWAIEENSKRGTDSFHDEEYSTYER